MNNSEQKKEHGLGFIPPSRFLKAIYWTCVVILVIFAWFNIRPYALFIQRVLLASVHFEPPVFLTSLLYGTPIGAIFRLIFGNFHWLLAAAIWALIQGIELLPIVIERNKSFLRTVIVESETSPKFEIRPDDDPALATLKKIYNKLPAEILKDAQNFAYFVYAIDFCVVFTVYPPCSGGFTRLGLLLSTGQWNKLNYDNVTAMFVTLFGVEVLVRLILWIGKFAYYVRKTYVV